MMMAGSGGNMFGGGSMNGYPNGGSMNGFGQMGGGGYPNMYG
jgi:hypothetical protein